MRKKLLRSRSGFEKPESREEAIMQNILGASNVLEPSESNIEEILKSILYNTPYTKEAEFEIEKILLAIKNNGTYDGECESRDMKILFAILNDLDYTEEAESRIEELFIEWLHQRSSIKVLEGIPPLTFTANGQPLLDYLISGNEEHNGTPTPDSPIMPQGTGERTGNLYPLDESKLHVGRIENDGTIDYEIGTLTVGTNSVTYEASTTWRGFYTDFIRVNENEKLTFSPINSATIAWSCNCYDENDNYLGKAPAQSAAIAKTFTLLTGTKKVRIGVASSNTTYTILRPMLNTGSTALPYEPYGYKIPISSANTTTNVYLGEVETTRKIKKLVFTGNETIGAYDSTYNRFSIIIPDSLIIGVRLSPVICSHYQAISDGRGIANVPNNAIYSDSGTSRWFIKTTEYTNGTDFKSYLAAQYAAGTPVTVWYVLATETTGIVNEPLMLIGNYADSISMEQTGIEIPTINGSNTFDVNTSVKPSNVYIEYK